MKTATSCVVALALMTAAGRVSAQERIDGRTPGPIGRAVALEAARLAAEPANTDRQPVERTNADWSRLSTLQPGTTITLMMIRRGRDIKGQFRSADEATVTITDGPSEVQKVARTDVFEIRREQSWIGRHPGPTGALIGAAAGFAWTALAVGPQCHEECGLNGLYFLSGAGAGAGIGAAVGSSIGAATHSKREQVVYRAP
jgi:hypothetical protein